MYTVSSGLAASEAHSDGDSMTYDLLPHSFFPLNDGGKLRYAEFMPAGQPKGTILIVPGRREFLEKKYEELGQPLLNLGFKLIIVEPRNHGLSSRILSGDLQQRDHLDDFALPLNDLRAFFAAIVQPNLSEPLIIHGHSMGGHLLLRWLAEDSPPVAKAFFTAPMLALAGMSAHLAAYGVTWASVRLFGKVTDYAPMQHDFNEEDCYFATNPLTQDASRFPVFENYFAAHPALTVGGVTWGWLLAALKSMQTAHAQPYLSRIPIPVLALVGAQDYVTPADEIARYLNHIPRVRTHVIAHSRHDILNETPSVRTEAWRHINAFLD